MLINHSVSGLNATSYIRMMAHTAAVNIGLYFRINGRIYTTSSACTSSSQAIGYSYEAIKHGYQTIMLAGGADELSASEAAVFDTLFATSTLNDTPELSPRPFDRDRDGLVIGEGAGTLILEERDRCVSAQCPHLRRSHRIRHQLRRPTCHPTGQPQHANHDAVGVARCQAACFRHRLYQRPRHRHRTR